MSSNGKLNIQGILNSDSNGMTNNDMETNQLTATPVSITNFLYKITGEGLNSKQMNVTDDYYISKLRSLPIRRSQSGYEFDIVKVMVKGGRKQTLMQILPDSQIQNHRKDRNEKPNLVELQIHARKGNDTANISVVVYYSGTTTITMGIIGDLIVGETARALLTQQVEAINKVIIQPFFPWVKGTGKFASISGQFKFNKAFNIEGLSMALPSWKELVNLKLPELEMKLPAFRFKLGNVRCVLFPRSGIFQLLGATTLKQMSDARNDILNHFKEYRLAFAGPSVNKVRKNKPIKKRKAELCPPKRRPNPTTGKCPLETQYKRPNDQGDLCCYRLPKQITNTLRQTVIRSYRNINKNVPTNVKNLLGIQNNGNRSSRNNKKNDLFNQLSINDDGVQRIKKRACGSYTLPQLVKFATQLGIILKPKRSKASVCRSIYAEWDRKYGNVRHMSMNVNGSMCKSWPKSKLVKWAKEHNVNANSKMTKNKICKLLYDRAFKNVNFYGIMYGNKPHVKSVRNDVLLHGHTLNSYSNAVLKHAAKQIKLNIPANSNKYDIIRKFNVKYMAKPSIAVRNGKLMLMNRNATSYNNVELKQIVRKLNNVNVSTNANKKTMIDAIFMSTTEGKQKQILNEAAKFRNEVAKLTPAQQKVMAKRGYLQPTEKLLIIKILPKIFKTVSRDVKSEHANKLKSLKKQLK